MEKVQLGGDRLGSGNKNSVAMHGFERSNHDLSYIWRSTMSPGTLVPFMCEVGMPGDTIDVKLNSECMTHPTVGPLFGSYKVQFDVFQVPIRLYNSWLHNNKLDVGRNMASVVLPVIDLNAAAIGSSVEGDEQINPSCILSYLGIRGVGYSETATTRKFNGVPLLAYWEIYKQYYANKQEEIGVVVHVDEGSRNPITYFECNGAQLNEFPTLSSFPVSVNDTLFITGTTNSAAIQVSIQGNWYNLDTLIFNKSIAGNGFSCMYNGIAGEFNWSYYRWNDSNTKPELTQFPLSNIDLMREAILETRGNQVFNVMAQGLSPYTLVDDVANGRYSKEFSQEGLAIKTYQSDIFNNWLNESWIGDIAAQSAVSTLGNSFTIDELTIKKKVWELLNRIAVSGGSYNDWLLASYDHKAYNRAETPVYVGGMSKELIFQEVVSNSSSEGQPLGTLAGRGKYSGKQKGGNITVKCDEHCYIIGLVSLTPRIDYSQGNRWDTGIYNMDEWHKPSMDQIGFQDLIVEQMAWWTTKKVGANWVQRSAGKQPAWINYQTNFNRTYGNFAVPAGSANSEMFMTLNRRYEADSSGDVVDLTTYIDPSKYNFIFADTEIDAQNFWMQIGVNIEARRKMSAKIMPNL